MHMRACVWVWVLVWVLVWVGVFVASAHTHTTRNTTHDMDTTIHYTAATTPTTTAAATTTTGSATAITGTTTTPNTTHTTTTIAAAADTTTAVTTTTTTLPSTNSTKDSAITTVLTTPTGPRTTSKTPTPTAITTTAVTTTTNTTTQPTTTTMNKNPLCPEILSMTPSGDDLYWEVGTLIDLTCTSVTPYITSRHLTFFKRLQFPIPSRVVNETTIQTKLKLHESEEFVLSCEDDSHITHCITYVHVGYEPLDVDDLVCVSMNWETLYCNWTIPQNPVQSLNYQPYLNSSSADTHNWEGNCTIDETQAMNQVWSCQCPILCSWWYPDAYIPLDKQLQVVFNAKNPLGASTFIHNLSNYATVLPNAVSGVRCEEVKGHRAVNVTWILPKPMDSFAEVAGIVVRIENRIYEATDWLMGEEMVWRNRTQQGSVVVELEYWFTEYQVRVRIRSLEARDSDEWWSSWLPYNFTSPSAEPSCGPALGPGSYQVNKAETIGNRHVILSWQPIQHLLHNGPNFTYIATATELQGGETVNADVVTDTFASFSNLSSTLSYKIEVASSNSVGVSNRSMLIIGTINSLPIAPYLPAVVAHVQPNRTIYELRWSREQEGKPAVNYTVYLCTDDYETPQPCQGQLYWLSVGNVTACNITLADLKLSKEAGNNTLADLKLNKEASSQLRFAVSGEGASGLSSGMSWDACSTPRLYTPLRSQPTVQKPIVEKDLVRIPWTAKCQDWAGVIEKVQASYCKGNHSDISRCHGHVGQVTSEVWSREVQLAGLEAGVEYTVWLKLMYRSGPSPNSNPERFITTQRQGLDPWAIGIIATGAALVTGILVAILLYSRRKILAAKMAIKRELRLPQGLDIMDTDVSFDIPDMHPSSPTHLLPPSLPRGVKEPD